MDPTAATDHRADPRDPTIRGIRITPRLQRWLAVALVGGFVAVAWPLLSSLYWIERAGSLLDRQIVTGDPTALGEAQRILGLGPPTGSPSPAAAPPAAGTSADSPTYWRTYGAVAARQPSEEAFERLLAARNRGSLDRMGRLWLAEVAAATGHWGTAQEEYARMDAVNLLLDRADDALAAGRRNEAIRWYETAAIGLLADDEQPLGDLGAEGESGGLYEAGAGKTMALLRVGLGLLGADAPDAAVPVLERAESEIHAYPPGVTRQQAVRFNLAEALARTMPPDKATAAAQRARIDLLIERAVAADETGWSRFQEARVRLLMEDRAAAVAALRAAVRLDQGHVDAYMSLGTLFEQDGLTSLARDLYGLGLRSVPEDPRLTVAYAKAVCMTQDPATALPALELAAKTDTTDPEVFALWGDTLLALGRPAEARWAYRQGLLRAPGSLVLTERRTLLVRPTGPIP